MEFGIQFFPDVSPAEKSAEQYFSEARRLGTAPLECFRPERIG